jgi:hypothetical protein
MIEAVAEAAVYLAAWNLGEAAEEEPRVPIWGRVLLSIAILTIVAAGILFLAKTKGIL